MFLHKLCNHGRVLCPTQRSLQKVWANISPYVTIYVGPSNMKLHGAETCCIVVASSSDYATLQVVVICLATEPEFFGAKSMQIHTEFEVLTMMNQIFYDVTM